MSGLTGLTGSNRGTLFQKQKGSLFMVKVKTVFCILCVCNPLFTSQHSLSWDTRLWPPLGGTTQTRWFSSNMPAEEFYQVHTTNLNRPPMVSSLIPRKPINAPPTGRPNPRRSPGPIYLPANIYKLLSDVAIKELKKHNATTRSTPPPKRAVNSHNTDPHPEHPPTETPIGDPTPPDSPADPDLDNTEPCEDFTFDDSTLEHIMDAYSPSYSVNKTHIYHVSKHSSSHYGSLIDRGPMVALLAQI